MFSLSPIPPTGTSRLASTPAKPVDYCVTPIPGRIPDSNPLSRTLAHVTEGYLALLGAHDSLNPIEPMWFQPGEGPTAPDLAGAMSRAERGIAAIDEAVSAYGTRHDEIATALGAAARDAKAGYQALTAERGLDVTPNVPRISQQFNSAATWLDVAGNLLALQLGTTKVPDGLVGFPEQDGPDSPDNPWFIGPKPSSRTHVG